MDFSFAVKALVGLCLATVSIARADAPSQDIKTEQERAALLYFVENAHPLSGLVRDKADNFTPTSDVNRVASIASTGFGLAVTANAAERGWMDRGVAEAYALKTVRFARDSVPRRKGWFLHFIDWENGSRMWGSEYSTIDTALFMAGALYAAQVFRDNKELAEITHELYRDMDFWDAMTDGGARPEKRTLSMAFMEGEGYTQAQWDMYAEQMVLLVLGLAHPTAPLPPETWLRWERKLSVLPDNQVVMGLDAALFIHQYSQVFIDFRRFQDGFRNYHDNARILSDYHRTLALEDTKYRTMREGFWGFSAGESPTGYLVWNPLHYQGTVCIGCTVASVMYNPAQILADLSAWRASPHGVWGRYGFSDSVDLDQAWVSPHVLGITVGPAYMSLVNMDAETSIWRTFMQIPEIQLGLARASGANLRMF